jgi:5'-methylthioadenosine phosphorylase
MHFDVGIIGGTGVGEILGSLPGRPIHVPTPSGLFRARKVRLADLTVVAVQRHAGGHRLPPHHVPYQAIALGLGRLGVRFCFSTAAVGSLKTEWPVGTLVACSDFIDLSARNETLFDMTVRHTDFSHPFSPLLRHALIDAAADQGVEMRPDGVYLNANGPRFETPAEIAMMARLGADLVGMTAASEAVVLREAGIEYACLAVVTNLAAGLSPAQLHHGEVTDAMREKGRVALDVIAGAVARVIEP